VKYLKKFNESKSNSFYQEIDIKDLYDKVHNVFKDESLPFTKKEIESLKKLNLGVIKVAEGMHELKIEKDGLITLGIVENETKIGNILDQDTFQFLLSKYPDDWFYVQIKGSTVNFKILKALGCWFECDGINGVLQFFKDFLDVR